jgi:hypothetical protein
MHKQSPESSDRQKVGILQGEDGRRHSLFARFTRERPVIQTVPTANTASSWPADLPSTAASTRYSFPYSSAKCSARSASEISNWMS